MSSKDSQDFYDEYVERQLRVGVNERHESILRLLARFGLRGHHRVLEIGSGVGTLTGLVAAALDGGGTLVGVEPSPRSVEAARERLAGLENVRMELGSALEVSVEGPFDVVVLPDVLEHIPLEDHGALFRRIADWVADDGFVLAHYPNPHYLAWCHRHRPELLQHLDQPIWADHLTAAAHGAGLILEHLETYAIWIREGDYQFALFRPPPADPAFHDRVRRAGLLARLRGWVGRFRERGRG